MVPYGAYSGKKPQSKSQAINLVKARMVRENLHIDEVFVRSVHKDLAARDKYLKKIGRQMKEAVEKGQPIDNPLYAWYEKRIKPVPRPIPIPPPQTDKEKLTDDLMDILGGLDL